MLLTRRLGLAAMPGSALSDLARAEGFPTPKGSTPRRRSPAGPRQDRRRWDVTTEASHRTIAGGIRRLHFEKML